MASKVTVEAVFAGDSKSLERTFKNVGEGSKDLAKDLEKAEKKSKDFGTAMDRASDSAGTGETAFMGTADILDGLGGAFGLPTEGATNLMRSFGDLQGGFSSITGVIGKVGGSLSSLAMGPVGLIIAGVAALAVGIIALYKNSETFRDIVSAAFEAVKKVLGPIVDGIGKAISWVTGLFKSNKEEVEEMPDVYRQQFEELKGILEGNRQKWQDWKDGVTARINDLMNPLQRARDQSKITFQEIANNLLDNIRFYEGWITNLRTLTDRGFGALASKMYELGPTAEKAVGEMVTKSDRELNNLNQLFTNAGNAATKSFMDPFMQQQSLRAMGDAGALQATSFKDGWSKGLGTINIPMNRVGPAIPQLAEGGIVTGPTLAMIGEAGPEAVVPLDRMGAGGVTIVVEGNVLDGTQLADLVQTALLRKQARTGPLGLA